MRTSARKRHDVQNVAHSALHRAPLHYTEGGLRWDAPEHPFSWHYADCSSFFTSCYKGAGLPDPNHDEFRAGYTGTLARYGRRVASPKVGDACLMGRGWPYEHVGIYDGNGYMVDHGFEGGPRRTSVADSARRHGGVSYRSYIPRGSVGRIGRRWVLLVGGKVVWRGAINHKLPSWVKMAAKFLKNSVLRRKKVKR